MTKKMTESKGKKARGRPKAKATVKRAKSKSDPKTKKKLKTQSKTTGTKKPSTESKKKQSNETYESSGLIIVEDDVSIDKEKINEERRAYLEEARSQDASD